MITVHDLLPDIKSFIYYQDNWEYFIEDFILLPKSKAEGTNFFLDDPQLEIVKAVNHNKRTSVVTAKGIGKCQWVEDEIMLADGSYVRCGDLIGKEFEVISRNPDGTHSIKKARAFDNGIKEVFGVTTDSGDELYRTGNHPLLTFDGWKQINDLSSGDKILSPIQIDHRPSKVMKNDDIKILAYMIGDGSCGKMHGVSFSQEDNAQLKELLGIFDARGNKYSKTSKYDYRICGLSPLLRKYGVLGKGSFDKYIPDDVFSVSKKQQALFLNRLYSTDGWVYTSKNHSEIGYCSVSYKLARGVKRLLKRLGVVSKIRTKKTSWTYKGVKKRGNAYCVDIHSLKDIIQFSEEIGIYGKETALKEAYTGALKKLPKSNSNKFRVFPKEAKEYFCDTIKSAGYSPKHKFGIDPSNKIGVSYRTIERINNIINDRYMNTFINTAYFDEITEIESIGCHQTVGIEVDDNHNYITDIYEHNTMLASCLALTFMTLYNYPKVAISAPAGSQLDSALWPEINKWLRNSALEPLFEHTRDYIKYVPDPASEWKIYRKTPKDETCAQGLHAPNMLIICDEASGVKDESLQAFDGTLTDNTLNNNKILLIGNGNRPDGLFFETHTKKGTKEYWKSLTYTAFQSRFKDDDQIKYIESRYGKDHPRYLIEVMGQFPDANAQSFISYADVMEASGRWCEYKEYCERYGKPTGPVELGLDCAGDGEDQNVVIGRHGNYVFKPMTEKYGKPKDIAKMATDYVKDIRAITGCDDSIKIKIDTTGGYGTGPWAILDDDNENNIQAVKVNFAWKANNETEYDSIASEMWDNVRYLMRDMILYGDDNFLLEELYTRKIAPSNRIKIQPKKEFKKEYKASPDRADALVLCFAEIRSDKTVVKEFDRNDSALVRTVEFVGNEKYGTVWTAKDLQLSCLYVGWDGFKLRVYDEYTSDDSISHLASDVSRHSNLIKVIGNKAMFNKNSDDDMSKKFRQFGVRLKNNKKFDELSGIESLNGFVRNKRIIIDPRCNLLIDQMRDWKHDVKRSELESKYGLCMALVNLVSFVKDKRSYVDSVGQSMGQSVSYSQPIKQYKNPNGGWMAS